MVVYAYDRLVSEGYQQPVARSGVFVSPAISLSRHSKWTSRSTGAIGGEPPPPEQPRLASPTPFRPCPPDVTLFPLPLWDRLRGRVLRGEGPDLLHYPSTRHSGLPAPPPNPAAPPPGS